MTEGDVPVINTKLTIDTGEYNCDLFVKLGWAHDRWVWLDVEMSRSTESHTQGDDPETADLRRQLADTTRRMMEVICRHASELLQSDERTIQGIMESSWRGTRFAPYGVCATLRTPNLEGKVGSPLDAVAQLIEQRHVRWEEQMRQHNG